MAQCQQRANWFRLDVRVHEEFNNAGCVLFHHDFAAESTFFVVGINYNANFLNCVGDLSIIKLTSYTKYGRKVLKLFCRYDGTKN